AQWNVTPPDRHLEPAAIAHRERGAGSVELFRAGRIEPAAPDLAQEQIAPELLADLLLLLPHPLLDLVPRAAGADVAQPVAARAGGRAGEDLDGIAVLQLAVQRRDASVDLRALALQSDLGVHVEREVDRRGALRQPLHV